MRHGKDDSKRKTGQQGGPPEQPKHEQKVAKRERVVEKLRLEVGRLEGKDAKGGDEQRVDAEMPGEVSAKNRKNPGQQDERKNDIGLFPGDKKLLIGQAVPIDEGLKPRIERHAIPRRGIAEAVFRDPAGKMDLRALVMRKTGCVLMRRLLLGGDPIKDDKRNNAESDQEKSGSFGHDFVEGSRGEVAAC